MTRTSALNERRARAVQFLYSSVIGNLRSGVDARSPLTHHPRPCRSTCGSVATRADRVAAARQPCRRVVRVRSEEHTSELQSQSNLVCRLLLEKKKKIHPQT